jgi:hypothetical protein
MGVAGGPDLIQDGLVLSLDASDRNSYVSGSTTWFDLSGLNNSGSLTNGPTFSSANLGSIVFDGSNDYVDVPLSSYLQFGTSDFTISYWVYPISKVSLYPSIFTNYNGYGTGAIYFGVDHSSVPNKYSFYINNALTPAYTNSNISYGSWEQIISVRDSGIIKLYLNGWQNGTTIDGTGITLNGRNSSVIRIAAIQGESNFYNGRISNIQIYNRALSAQEIQQNYNAQKSKFGL